MSASSLMSVLRLAHGVLDFLIRQPEDEVLAFAQGRSGLAFVSGVAPAEAASQASTPTVPAPTTEASVAARPRRGRATIDEREAAEIAETLRRFETESEGGRYLDGAARNNDDRKLIAEALNVQGARGMAKAALVEHILRHAIGARRTFAGLTSW